MRTLMTSANVPYRTCGPRASADTFNAAATDRDVTTSSSLGIYLYIGDGHGFAVPRKDDGDFVFRRG